MNLDNGSIANIKSMKADILNICNNNFPVQLDAFRETLANLRRWADDTIVGQNVEDEMRVIVKEIENLISMTNDICKSVEFFCDRQEQINSQAG